MKFIVYGKYIIETTGVIIHSEDDEDKKSYSIVIDNNHGKIIGHYEEREQRDEEFESLSKQLLKQSR